ncbi:hypothetical protein [Paenimyroides baculatum]|uniref:Uncharacterized protein n=1 Tax=Paenimyroides baculatum TaxID=2608000 RepID=A0A5M6CLG7_9FLAO|nr:hypothetical protein [Paenimyroides baculatum]KAA5533979.1 hypothetical protein F0460_11640 [Paenimyroides baculatum]
MLQTKSHIRNFRHIVLMWFMLFSLSPCTVKEAMLSTANTAYAKPLNISKATAAVGSCLYLQDKSQQISVAYKFTVNKQFDGVDFCGNQYFGAHPTKVCSTYQKTSSGNSPPKYILYKRLKIAIV